MTSLAMAAEGLAFARGDGASPEVFTTISELRRISGPSGQATVRDVSHFQSTGKEKRMGLPDEGQWTIEGNFIPSAATQDGLLTDRNNQTLRNFQITWTDSPATIATFSAYVLSFETSAGVDEDVSFSCVLEVSELVAWT